MRINPLRTLALGVAGLVGAGVLAFQQPGTITATDDPVLKRDEDSAALTVVSEDADDDDLELVADTSRSRDSRSRASGNTTGDNSRSGKRSGRDDSWSGRQVKDWTRDGKNDKRKRDWSQNRTNDRSRHNTR